MIYDPILSRSSPFDLIRINSFSVSFILSVLSKCVPRYALHRKFRRLLFTVESIPWPPPARTKNLAFFLRTDNQKEINRSLASRRFPFRAKIVNRRYLCSSLLYRRYSDSADFHRLGNHDSIEFFPLLHSVKLPSFPFGFYDFIQWLRNKIYMKKLFFIIGDEICFQKELNHVAIIFFPGTCKNALTKTYVHILTILYFLFPCLYININIKY